MSTEVIFHLVPRIHGEMPSILSVVGHKEGGVVIVKHIYNVSEAQVKQRRECCDTWQRFDGLTLEEFKGYTINKTTYTNESDETATQVTKVIHNSWRSIPNQRQSIPRTNTLNTQVCDLHRPPYQRRRKCLEYFTVLQVEMQNHLMCQTDHQNMQIKWVYQHEICSLVS